MTKKVGNIAKLNKKAYIDFVEFCDRVGIWNLSLTRYSEMSGKATSTVEYWRNKYLKETKFDVDKFATEIGSQGLASLKRIASISQGKDKSIALKASRSLLTAADKYADVLTKLGVIQAPEEELSVQINASDKDLYKILTIKQRKKLAKIAEEA